MDWSLLPDCLVDRGLNRGEVVSRELAIDGEFNGSRLVSSENPNHADHLSTEAMQASIRCHDIDGVGVPPCLSAKTSQKPLADAACLPNWSSDRMHCYAALGVMGRTIRRKLKAFQISRFAADRAFHINRENLPLRAGLGSFGTLMVMCRRAMKHFRRGYQ